MEQTGKVVAVDGKVATVEIKRLSACDSCHNAESGCAVCSLLSGGSTHTSCVRDPIGVSVGDRVLIVADDSRILAYSLLVFVLPLLAAAAAYGVAVLLGAEALWRAASAVISFIAFYVLLYFTLNKSEKKRPASRIVRIISEDVEGERDAE